MAEVIYPCKIDKDIYELDWIGHSDAISRYGQTSDNDKFVNAHRHEATVWGQVTDDNASYSYDDWALVEIGDRFFLINTAGCSCPSPTETWAVACEPGDIASQWAHLQSGDYQGWTVPGRQMSDFCKLFQFVAAYKGIPDPTIPTPKDVTPSGEKS